VSVYIQANTVTTWLIDEVLQPNY